MPVLGFGTGAFPGFYRRDSGSAVPWRVDCPTQVAGVFTAHRGLGARSGIVLANPVPEGSELDRQLHDRVLAEGLARVAASGIRGREVTPALLAHFHEATGGASLACNVELVKSNATLAALVAVELSGRPGPR